MTKEKPAPSGNWETGYAPVPDPAAIVRSWGAPPPRPAPAPAIAATTPPKPSARATPALTAKSPPRPPETASKGERRYPFRLDVVELGTDDDGGQITSCVVVPGESAVDPVRRILPPKSGNQRIMWNAIGELLRDSKSFGKAGAPATRPCVELEMAVDQLRTRLACEPKRQTERTRAAISGLVERGLLCLREGWVWCSYPPYGG